MYLVDTHALDSGQNGDKEMADGRFWVLLSGVLVEDGSA